MRDALKLKDLRVVRPLRVHPTHFSLNLLKPIFVVLSLNVLITTTSANIGPSTLVFLLYQRQQVLAIALIPQLCILIYQVTHFLRSEVISITIVVGSVLSNAAFVDSVFKLENLVLQILELFLMRSNRLCHIVSIQLILLCNVPERYIEIKALFSLLGAIELYLAKIYRNLFQLLLKLIILPFKGEFLGPRKPLVKLLDSISKVLNFLLQFLLLILESSFNYTFLFSLIVVSSGAIAICLDLPLAAAQRVGQVQMLFYYYFDEPPSSSNSHFLPNELLKLLTIRQA